MINYPTRIIFTLCLAVVVLAIIGCERQSGVSDKMDLAESLLNSKPDSALSILNAVNIENLDGRSTKARYALLKSMALDKNCIDTTSFDVLQPAIDYYLDKGSPDDKLRTLYYQGRIFMNKSDLDMAMQTFLKANDFRNECKDTLTYANMLVAQSILNYSSYQMEDYVSNNLMAADLYGKLNNDGYRQSSLIKALDGSIALRNKQLADSILSIVDSLDAYVPEYKEESLLVQETYLITFEPEA